MLVILGSRDFLALESIRGETKLGYITLLASLPIVWNMILGILVMMIYIKVIISILGKLVNSGKISSDISRKVIHIAGGSFVWVWLFMDPSDSWSFIFNISAPFVFFVTFLKKGTTGSPDDPDVITMTRTGDPRDLLKGPLYFTAIMIIAGTIFFGSFAGMLMMAIAAWGDGLAPWIGKRWGKHKYHSLGRTKSIEKSIEGSIGVLVFGIIGSLLLFTILGIVGGPLSASNSVLAAPNVDLLTIVGVIIILSVVAMIVEAISPADIDNLLIPASTIIMLVILDALLHANFVVVGRYWF